MIHSSRLGIVFVLLAAAVTLHSAPAKTDPLTGLPLLPETRNKFDPGDPTVLPATNVCKSKQEADFYTVYDIKVSKALEWCAANLNGFRKAHGYAAGRSQDTFYKPDGTLVVSVTGTPAKDGEDAKAYSIVYLKFTPGLSEQAVIGLGNGKVVCP